MLFRSAWVVVGRVSGATGAPRVSARLVRTADAAHAWAESYAFEPGGDPLLERAIAHRVAATAVPDIARLPHPERAPPPARPCGSGAVLTGAGDGALTL